jgi:hypothetical protein
LSGAALIRFSSPRRVDFGRHGGLTPSFPTFDNKARPEDVTFFLDVGEALHLYRSERDPKANAAP